MIYLILFLEFFKVGLFAFGGAYGAIPLIRDVVLDYGWLNDERFTYFVAVSESTPGPIMTNLATYVGSNQAGFLGSVVATVAVVLPSSIIVLLLMILLKNLLKKPYVQAALRGIKPSVVGIILATGAYMIFKNCFLTSGTVTPDWKAIVITLVLMVASFGYKKMKKKQLSGISLILISAVVGIVIYW